MCQRVFYGAVVCFCLLTYPVIHLFENWRVRTNVIPQENTWRKPIEKCQQKFTVKIRNLINECLNASVKYFVVSVRANTNVQHCVYQL